MQWDYFQRILVIIEETTNTSGQFLSHIRKSRGYVPIMAFQNISSGILENSAAGWFSDQILKGTVEIEY